VFLTLAKRSDSVLSSFRRREGRARDCSIGAAVLLPFDARFERRERTAGSAEFDLHENHAEPCCNNSPSDLEVDR
jgi:hypothetical protein